jgi:hypothetical protein
MPQKLVLCAAESRSQANRIVGHLINAGIAHTTVSVIFPQANHAGNGAFLAGAAAKTGVGALLGGAFIWLTGVGVLSVPGIGSLIIAGAPLITALERTLRGGLSGALAGIGLSQSDALCYEEKIRHGSLLISVGVEESMEIIAVKKIMQALNAQNIAITGQATASPFSMRAGLINAAIA